MENVTKKLPLILSIFTALTFVSITIHQSGLIKDLRFDLGNTLSKLGQTQQELATEIDKNEALEQQVALLKDSVEIMHLKIVELNDKVGELKKKVSSLSKTIAKQEERIGQLNKRINALKMTNSDNEQEISRLQSKLEQELIEMEDIDRLRAEKTRLSEAMEEQQAAHQREISRLQASIEEQMPPMLQQYDAEIPATKANEPEVPVMEAPAPKINQSPDSPPVASSMQDEMKATVENRKQGQILNIVQNTSVLFSNITLRNNEDGKDLKKIKDDKWRYTFITFDLENQDKEAIVDEKFILQLYDVDKDQVVPFNERNPIYPESEQGAIGFKFQYIGTPITLRYFNTQIKESANYEIRLVYLNKNMTIPLNKGKLKIVENGNVIPL